MSSVFVPLVVAASIAYGNDAGAMMFQRGGNAVDAAVTASAQVRYSMLDGIHGALAAGHAG